MAKKRLANQVLGQKAMLAGLAGASKEFTKKITEETSAEELNPDDRNKIVWVKDEDLLDDPNNVEVYGDSDIEGLTRSMQTGFQGVILAYPYKGKYRIESGHRRRDAARNAGHTKYPVYPTEPPKTEYERVIRLHRANSHSRKCTPLVYARQAEDLFIAFQDMIAYEKAEEKKKREDGIVDHTENEEKVYDANVRTSLEMEMSVKHVQKYRALLKLIPELQTLADSGDYSWSSLAGAATLKDEYQAYIYKLICKKAENVGKETITMGWLNNIIREVKNKQDKNEKDVVSAEELLKTSTELIGEKNEARKRRKNGKKVILKATQDLHSVLDEEALYNTKDIPELIKALEDIEKSIVRKLEEFKKKNDTSS